MKTHESHYVIAISFLSIVKLTLKFNYFFIMIESIKQQILIDAHSPYQFRVKGPLSNLKEFANDFECPKGSPMNPVAKCEIW